jgi:hypothetical protein
MARLVFFLGIGVLAIVFILGNANQGGNAHIPMTVVAEKELPNLEGNAHLPTSQNGIEQELRDVLASLPAADPALPAAMRRTLADIAAVRDADFDQLTRPLKQSDDAWGMLMVQMRCNDFSRIVMNSVLADRRTRRLYELLANMPQDQAGERISAAFDMRFDEFCREMERTNYRGAAGMQSANLGLSGLLFLCSEYCDLEIFLEKLDDWTDWYEGAQMLLTANPEVSKSFVDVRPDPMFVVNLYMKCLVERGVDIAELNVQLDVMARAHGLRGFPKLQETCLGHWLVHTSEHASRPWAVQTVIPYFRTCDPAVEFIAASGQRPHIVPIVLAELRSWVDEELEKGQ